MSRTTAAEMPERCPIQRAYPLSGSPTQLQRCRRVLRKSFALEVEMTDQLRHPARRGAVELELEYRTTTAVRWARVLTVVNGYIAAFDGVEPETFCRLIHQVS